MKELNFIDLFAGASGMSEGFIKAGFNPIAHIEMNEEACFTIKTRAAYHYLKSENKLDIYKNYIKKEISREEFYKKIPDEILNSVLNFEINDNSIKDIFKKLIKEKQNIDLIIGGPPCQAYSLLGRHHDNIENDPRNKLYIQYGRFLKEFNPKAFVFENVPGILSANKGQHFKNLKTYFRKLGYEVYHDTLDASDYGVVQARKRIIIIGWKKNADFGFPDFDKEERKYTVNEAFSDLPDLKPGESYQYTKYKEQNNNYLEKFNLRDGIDFVIQHISRPHNERDLTIYKTALRKWNHEQIRMKYPDLPDELKTHKNESSFIDRFKVVNGNGVSHTVVAHIAKDGHYYIHPDEEQCRSISVREAARLQSFPDDFYFEGSRSAAFKQIGNAVPPLMAYAIAKKNERIIMTDIQKELNNGFYQIRPAARIIYTIGSDLIGDSYSALIELVKNSYDADASRVDIVFEYGIIDDQKAITITVKDNGHGMDFNTVINKWLVPATDDKLQRKVSTNKKRHLQGRKGIGRFAASILGQEMTLSSVDMNGNKSTAVIDWRLFKSNDYLENIDLLVENIRTQEMSGTTLEMVAKNEEEDDKISVWDKSSINNLIQELRKLISPFSDFDEDNFDINLSFINSPFPEFNDNEFKIETYPIIKYYDYRINGTIDKRGKAKLVFEDNLNPESTQYESINGQYEIEGSGKYCGLITIDIRVFDREPEAIDNLINKGLINPINNKYMGKNEAKRLLNEVYGVNIYKNNFRIRPYGNGGIDWLDLDKDRIQNFAQKVSNNQVIGFITIESEEVSGLEEKSARDGLKENEYYLGLKELSKKALAELETRRFIIRTKSNKSRVKNDNFQDTVTNLFSLSTVKSAIDTRLKNLKVTEEARVEINNIFEKEEEKNKSLRIEIEKTIAIYQGQATLGKIVNYILHEGRKPIQFFNSETTVLERYIKHYKATKDEEVLTDLSNSIEGFKTNSKIISGLFKRINPLAKQNRRSRENFKIKKIIEDCFKIFQSSLIDLNIEVEINCNQDLTVYGWEEDLYTALTNLIENSIYWLGLSKKNYKKIVIEVSETSDTLMIDFIDNGSGLSHTEIESEIIFEPGYSKKLNGTGLGLAISGEAVERLNGKLSARKYNDGAYFQIEIIK